MVGATSESGGGDAGDASTARGSRTPGGQAPCASDRDAGVAAVTGADGSGSRRPLSVSIVADDRADPVIRLAVSGELDLRTVDQLAAALSAQLADGCRTLLLDLSGLSFCDVTGMNALLRAHRAFTDAGSLLIVTGYRPPLARYLRLTGLDRILYLF